MCKYVLATTDGEEIRSTTCDSLPEAQKAMRDAYAEYTPDEWNEDYEDISYCGEMNAILYDNGNGVYVWQIIEVKF